VQLVQHHTSQYAIQSIESGYLVINQQRVEQSFCLQPSALMLNLDAHSPLTLSDAKLAELIALAPDVVILASKLSIGAIPAKLRAAFLSRGIGIEIMELRAACYTYNVLVSEQRNVMLIGFFD
jgi:uncharacterized protein